MLYIIKQYPVDPATLKKTNTGDTVILAENAVLAAKRDILDNHSLVKKTFTHLNLCVLKDDLKTKGISTQEVAQGVSILDNQDYKYLAKLDEAVRSWN